jgi:tetratricopeptide (TPR) repeat protein
MVARLAKIGKGAGPLLGICAVLGGVITVPNALAAAGAVDLEPSAPYRAPFVPQSDAESLQQVPSISDPAVAQIRRLQAARDAAPQDLSSALALANAYVDYSRQVGDAHYAGYAEAVIAPWMKSMPRPVDVLVTQATILQYRHQFDAARGLLQEVLRRDPRQGQAWLTLATLDMVQGDYSAASHDCAQVAGNAGVEWALACGGSLRSYIGQGTQSLAMLRQAEAAGIKAAAGYQAWVQGLIAETAERLGDWPLAEQHYRHALQLLPRDNFLLVAYADFLLDRGRPAEVLPLLATQSQSDTAFLRLALAQAALGSPDAGRYTWIMAARFEALTLRGSDFFGREQARFALQLQHDPATALDMATRNWQQQRAPLDSRVLLEAALAADQPQAAAAALEFLQKTHLQDATVTPLVAQLRERLLRFAGGPR